MLKVLGKNVRIYVITTIKVSEISVIPAKVSLTYPLQRNNILFPKSNHINEMYCVQV
jgi:hypothetical protein